MDTSSKTTNSNAQPGFTPGPIEVACTQPSVAELEARIAYLRGVNADLCAAISWYADERNYDTKGAPFDSNGREWGSKARLALARARGGAA